MQNLFSPVRLDVDHRWTFSGLSSHVWLGLVQGSWQGQSGTLTDPAFPDPGHGAAVWAGTPTLPSPWTHPFRCLQTSRVTSSLQHVLGLPRASSLFSTAPQHIASNPRLPKPLPQDATRDTVKCFVTWTLQYPVDGTELEIGPSESEVRLSWILLYSPLDRCGTHPPVPFLLFLLLYGADIQKGLDVVCLFELLFLKKSFSGFTFDF